MMPVVSINLSRAAYEVFQEMPNGRRSRMISYLLERNHDQSYTRQNESNQENCVRCRGVVAPQVREGDMRFDKFGTKLRWGSSGWEIYRAPVDEFGEELNDSES